MKKILLCTAIFLAIISTFICCTEPSSDNNNHEHSGVGTCTVCNVEFATIWKDFIDKNSTDGNIAVEGQTAMLFTYTGEYDCVLFIQTSPNEYGNKKSLSLFYNAYDRKWDWSWRFGDGSSYDLTAVGSFSKWSSRSNSLSFTSNSLTLSELLPHYKVLYNPLIDEANAKLKEYGYSITMANFGLEK